MGNARNEVYQTFSPTLSKDAIHSLNARVDTLSQTDRKMLEVCSAQRSAANLLDSIRHARDATKWAAAVPNQTSLKSLKKLTKLARDLEKKIGEDEHSGGEQGKGTPDPSRDVVEQSGTSSRARADVDQRVHKENEVADGRRRQTIESVRKEELRQVAAMCERQSAKEAERRLQRRQENPRLQRNTSTSDKVVDQRRPVHGRSSTRKDRERRNAEELARLEVVPASSASKEAHPSAGIQGNPQEPVDRASAQQEAELREFFGGKDKASHPAPLPTTGKAKAKRRRRRGRQTKRAAVGKGEGSDSGAGAAGKRPITETDAGEVGLADVEMLEARLAAANLARDATLKYAEEARQESAEMQRVRTAGIENSSGRGGADAVGPVPQPASPVEPVDLLVDAAGGGRGRGKGQERPPKGKRGVRHKGVSSQSSYGAGASDRAKPRRHRTPKEGQAPKNQSPRQQQEGTGPARADGRVKINLAVMQEIHETKQDLAFDPEVFFGKYVRNQSGEEPDSSMIEPPRVY